jgi:nucleotide-binding universal stress UspA family protein
MAIKDVLVCLDASETGEGRLRLAAGLGREHGAHLAAAYLLSELGTVHGHAYGPGAIAIGIGMTEPAVARIGEGNGDGTSPDRMPELSQRALQAETIEHRFRAILQADGTAGDWHLFDRGEAAGLIALAKTVDLVVIGQHLPDAAAGAEFRPEEIVVACGRPLLVVPYAGNFSSVGKRVLIAWDGSREATRAVHDALPLIAAADAVTVVSVASRERGLERHHASVDRIVRHLERHGLAVRREEDMQAGLSVCDLLLSRAGDLDADLIVAGAYHHSRFREAMLGGVSRDLLDHMTVPVLMSH